MNDYFVSISTVDDSNASLPPFTHRTENILNFLHIEESEIVDVVQTLIVNKASGDDQISHRILKNTCHTIKNLYVYYLIGHFVNVSSFCLEKYGLIMPLFKKRFSRTTIKSSTGFLLNTVGKLMERIIFKHMYNFLHINDLIYKNQSGFLPGHSTVYQLLDIYHQICQSIDSKQHTCMIFCDISKAFDRVWHKGLLFKLRQNGITNDLLRWISDYLSERRQGVFIGSSVSEPKHVSAGVPQGSVLGPLFFLICVNDIAENLLSITGLFADDTSLAFSSSDVKDTEGILNHDLRMIVSWAKQWLVSFNPSKTVAILFSTALDLVKPSPIFNNTILDFVDNHKRLGLTLSSDEKWHAHIDNILTSASRTLDILRSLKYKLCRKALNQIYLSYLRPFLKYASVV